MQAQKANEARYGSGRMKFTLDKATVSVQGPVERMCEWVEATVEWRGDLTHTRLVRIGPSLKEIDPSSSVVRHAEEYIVNETEFIVHVGNHRVLVAPIAGRNLTPEQHANPANSWYKSQFLNDISCIGFYDRLITSKYKSRVDVSEIKSGELRLECINDQTREKTVASFSLKSDGNPTHFEYDSREQKSTLTRDFKWVRDGAGRTILDELDGRAALMQSGRPVNARSLFKVIEFDPEYKPKADAFTLRGLNLPPGVFVEDQIRKTTYRIGEPAPTSVFDSLGGLSGSMKARGFAAPGR